MNKVDALKCSECDKPATTVCILLTRRILRCHEHEDDFISVVLGKIPIEEWVGA